MTRRLLLVLLGGVLLGCLAGSYRRRRRLLGAERLPTSPAVPECTVPKPEPEPEPSQVAAAVRVAPAPVWGPPEPAAGPMHVTPGRRVPLPRARWLPATASIGLLLAACQPQVQPRLFTDSTLGEDSNRPAPAVAAATVTHTVQRGTIRDVVTVPGKIAPARSAQLNFPNGGTVTAIYVHSGQTVKQDEPLAELQLTPEAVEAAQRQALLAQLTYENQAAKLKELKAGARPGVLAAARASITRALVALRQAELHQAQLASMAASDTDLADAQLGLDQANADLDSANAAVNKQVGAAGRDREQQRAEADKRLAAAAATVRADQRKLAEATHTRDETVARQGAARAARQKEVHLAELALQDARVQVQAAESAAQQARAQAADPHHPAGADDAVHIAEAQVREAQIRVETEQTHLDQARAALDDPADEAELNAARLAVEQAQDDLQQAQAEQNDAQGRRDALASTQATDVDAAMDADPAVRAARARVDTAALKLQRAQAAQTAAGQELDVQRQLADLEVQTRQADLAAAQAHLVDLQNVAGPDEIDREERLANLLRSEADQARAASQPALVLRAPFDGLVTAVAVSPGQLIEPRATVIRFAGNERLSVIATASETEVSQLSADQQVTVTFPSLPSVSVQGTITDISGVGSVEEGGKRTAFPVRVDLNAAPDSLKIGMSALVTLSLREAHDVLSVPSDTLRQVERQTLVSRLEPDGRVTDVPVQVGGTYGSDVEITGGLHEGDVVAIFSTATSAAARKP